MFSHHLTLALLGPAPKPAGRAPAAVRPRAAGSRTGRGGRACRESACRGCPQTESRLARVALLDSHFQRARLPGIGREGQSAEKSLAEGPSPSGSAITADRPSGSAKPADRPSASAIPAGPPSPSAIPTHPRVSGLNRDSRPGPPHEAAFPPIRRKKTLAREPSISFRPGEGPAANRARLAHRQGSNNTNIRVFLHRPNPVTA